MADIEKLEEKATFKQKVVGSLFWVALVVLGLLIVLLLGTALFDVCFPATLGKSTDSMGQCEVGTLIERLGFAIGGTVALLIGLASYERVEVLREGAKAQSKAAESQIRATEMQITTTNIQENKSIRERYNNNSEKLEDEKEGVRIVAINELNYLAIENETFRRRICDTLCAHVRVITASKDYKEKYSEKPSNEIQTILDILTKKKDEEKIPFESKWMNLSNSYFVGVNLFEACLKNADLREVNFENANLWKANFKKAKLDSVLFRGANLREANFEYIYLENSRFNKLNLTMANFRGALLINSNFEDAILNMTHFEGADLSGSYLKGAVFTRSHLEGASLYHSNLMGANFSMAHLECADLGRTNLKQARLKRANLQGARLIISNLQYANFEESNVEGVDLSQTDIDDAELNGSNFEGAYNLEDNISEKTLLKTGIARLKSRINKDTELAVSEKYKKLKSKEIEERKRVNSLPENCVIVGVLTEEKVNKIIAPLEKLQEELCSDKPQI